MNNGAGEVSMPDMSVTIEQCKWTEEQAKTASSTVTSTVVDATMKATTVCNKK